MKICMVGKYPPIEGGVSARNYWIARGLAERGHEVHLVTNADEVEPAYRMYLEEDDRAWFEPRFEGSGGFVSLNNAEAYSPRKMSHIPLSNPFGTKLASVATDVVRQRDCELIFSYYFEPYGMAGYLASRWTGRPFVIQHAGSDLDRLMKVPDLSTAYREILNAADFVVAGTFQVNRFMAIGVDERRINSDLIFGVPTSIFNPTATTIDLSSFLRRASRHISDTLKWRSDPIDLSKPTIGIYGKVGLAKGSYDLVTALSKLKRDGLDFNFLAMTQGTQCERFANYVREAGMEDRTWILPFLPHWKVPGFIQACTAVCFLERDFSIAIHGPTVPREVLACGKCLILSDEILKKQFYRDRLADMENLLVVNNPKDHNELADKLRYVIEDPKAAAGIGTEAHKVSVSIENFTRFIDGYEKLFSECESGRDFARRVQRDVNTRIDSASAGLITAHLPYTSKLLSTSLDDIVNKFNAREYTSASKLDQVRSFCAFVRELLDRQELEPTPPYFSDVLSYEATEISMLAGDDATRLPLFSARDRFSGHDFKAARLAELRPLRTNHCRVKTFAYDVQGLIDSMGLTGELPTPVERKPTSILFARLPNMRMLKLKINEATGKLLELCDGTNITRSIYLNLARSWGINLPGEIGGLEDNFAAALRQLYERRVIIFC